MILCLLQPDTCESAEELRNCIGNLEKYRDREDWETVQYDLEEAKLLLKVKEGKITLEQLHWRRLKSINQCNKEHQKGPNLRDPILDEVLVKE